MDGNERRNHIIEALRDSGEPITGSSLAKSYSVSRQVIVQDIALLRAEGYKILSTSSGYMVYEREKEYTRLLALQHEAEAIGEELRTIVDLGGTIMNVMVEHPVYGEITADLMIASRRHVDSFLEKLEKKGSVPLMRLKSGEHYHLIKASSHGILDEIEEALANKGFLKNT